MRVEEKQVTLKNGQAVLLRGPEIKDAQTMLDFLKATAGESENLGRAPEEATLTLAQEEEFLHALLADERRAMVNAYVGGELVGNVSLTPVGHRARVRHRCVIGIAVRRALWGQGLGRQLLAEAIALAGRMGYLQAELGVFADNARAIALYESLGFETWGRVRGACRMPDGRLRDELMMGRIL